jgi:hypothetical protein
MKKNIKSREDYKNLVMEFDMNTIQHLGISMYSKLPPVIAEIIANSFDAEAKKVRIELYDVKPEEKYIRISDDGNGMEFTEINEKYLKIGRNRRTEEQTDVTLKLKRKIIGRKGIGKLSIFGIAEEVTIETVSNGRKNKFFMSLDGIKKSSNKYFPDQLIKNSNTSDRNGTCIELKKLKRKSNFDSAEIAQDLSRRFLVFDKDFEVTIIHNNSDKIIKINNELRFKNIDIEFTWEFPCDLFTSKYDYATEISGKVFTAKTPVPEDYKGLYLVARGKLVHGNNFYGIRSSDYAHAYLTGWLNVDFIDENSSVDLISTNRESLMWEDEKLEDLKTYLQSIISYVTQDWRKRRKEKKEKEITNNIGFNIDQWITSLPKTDQKIARKITGVVLNDHELNIEKSSELINYFKDVFEFESFKEFASELDNLDNISETDILKILKDWHLIEHKEFYKLALIRIEAIKKFEYYIKNNAKEVPTIHIFFKELPWLLDPRIMNFRDEVTYSKLLKEKFIEDSTLDIENKRIDFLCVDFASTYFIIELKRPQYKINAKDLDQALEYSSFIENKLGNNIDQKRVIVIIVSGGVVNTPVMKKKVNSFRESNDIIVRTYLELLATANKYHSEFITKYEHFVNNVNP